MSDPAPGLPPQPPCVEHGIWTPIPLPRPKGSLALRFKEVDREESRVIKKGGKMTFHAVGCSGDFADHQAGRRVAKAMSAQVTHPVLYGGNRDAAPASFLFHLGDIVYKPEAQATEIGKEQSYLYNTQFYQQFTHYPRKIFAAAGNHDGKNSLHKAHAAILHFLKNFCNAYGNKSSDNGVDSRKTMTQPYPYWLLKTPVAYFICLYTNDNNGGNLDDPTSLDKPQYEWLIKTLRQIKKANKGKAVFLVLHYPPYSGARSFLERGDPNLGPTPRLAGRRQEPLGVILQRAFRTSLQYPDIILSAHAHHYQRITYSYGKSHQIPCLVAGCGGHGPLEKLATACDGTPVPLPGLPFDILKPPGLKFPRGESARVVKYNDEHFGFLRLTVNLKEKNVVGEFFAVQDKAVLFDSFTLDLKKRQVIEKTAGA